MTNTVDMTKGPIAKNLIINAVPLILIAILQMLFNAADIAVVGQFVSSNAVAAVGASSSINSLFVAFFLGFSVGSNIVLAKCVGAKDKDGASKTVGTSLILSLIVGVLLAIIGVPLSRTFLIWMNCDPVILDWATIYLQLFFLGMPISMLYNFVAAILRAVGDNKRPLIYIAIAGVVNVGLNVFFVLVCGMTVEGVAIATIVSKLISAVLCLIALFRADGYEKATWKNLRIYKEQLKEILKIGLPTGAETIMFNLTSVVVQTTINGFQAVGMSAFTTATQFDGIVYQVGHGFALSVMSFVGQNVGAKNVKRIKEVVVKGIFITIVFSLAIGCIFAVLSKWLCGLMVNEVEVIELASQKLIIMSFSYFLSGIAEICTYAIRAMGKTTLPLVISLVLSCVLKIATLKLLLHFIPYFYIIFINETINYVLVCLAYAVIVPIVYKWFKKKIESEKQKEDATKQNQLVA